jgi:hypothetical protein
LSKMDACDKSKFRPIKTFACQNFDWKPRSRFLEPDKTEDEIMPRKDESWFSRLPNLENCHR